jgi:TldD protein
MTLQTDEYFFTNSDLDGDSAKRLVDNALDGMDDGELFLEYCQSESLSFDDGTLRSSSFDISQGFGLRAVQGEATGYAFASEINEAAIKRAKETVRAVKSGHNGAERIFGAPSTGKAPLYTDSNPLNGAITFEIKVKLLEEIDAYLRAKDNRVKQVSASLAGEWQAVQIIRNDTAAVSDIRPLVRLNITVVVEQNGRMERGTFGGGGRAAYDGYIAQENWQNYANQALEKAIKSLDSVPARAGQMHVVLAPGWPGIILHEAIGHGLEGDCNRKGTSSFANLMGEQIAAKGVTVVDDGTIADRRGSLTVDDEGTPTESTTLIEDGKLVGYMQDRLNARLMGQRPTGNGRRESYEYQPLPRMTNTYMKAGDRDPEEIISSVKDGLYCVSFSGGQVDTTSGKFVFSASEAYRIVDGKIAEPVKGATLIGSGAETLKNISMIGNDLELDNGIGTCGKDGQGVPVGVGQPTIKVDNITVGGTEI